MESERANYWRRDEQARLYHLLHLEANLLNAHLDNEEQEKESPLQTTSADVHDVQIGEEVLNSTNNLSFSLKGAGRRKTICNIAVHEFGLRLHLNSAGAASTEDIAYGNINYMIVAHRKTEKGQETRIILGMIGAKYSQLLFTQKNSDSLESLQLLLLRIRETSLQALKRVEQAEPTGALVAIVSQLNSITGPEDLEMIFSRFGKILSCRKEAVGSKRNDAVIVFSSPASAIECLAQMNKVLIDDCRINVDLRVVRPRGSELTGLWRYHPAIDSIDETSRFCGILDKDRLEFYFSDTCVSSVFSIKPHIVNLREVEIVHFERSFGSSGARATDVIFVMKRLWTLSEYSKKSEFSRCMLRIDGVSALDAEKIKDCLTQRGVVFFQNEAPLRWELVLKHVLQCGKYFWEDAGWSCLAPADPKDDDDNDAGTDEEDPADPDYRDNGNYVYNSADEESDED